MLAHAPRSSARRAGWWALGLAALLSVACNKSDEIEWVQFNTSGDTLLVGVGTAEPVSQSSRCQESPGLCEGEQGCICLRSSLAAHDVGTASIDPSFGPVGTRHLLSVEVLDDFEDIVQRVTVIASSERGEDELELRQDSADPGSWRVELESLGDPSESRTDTLEIRLYEPEGVFSAEEEAE